MRVLCVDDDPVSLLLLQGVLSTHGYDCVGAATGSDAVRAYLRDQEVQIVLLDWMLPDMNGPEVCRRIRKGAKGRPTFVIMVTALHAAGEVQAGIEAGVDGYLLKPIDAARLAGRVSLAVDALAAPQASAQRSP